MVMVLHLCLSPVVEHDLGVCGYTSMCVLDSSSCAQGSAASKLCQGCTAPVWLPGWLHLGGCTRIVQPTAAAWQMPGTR